MKCIHSGGSSLEFSRRELKRASAHSIDWVLNFRLRSAPTVTNIILLGSHASFESIEIFDIRKRTHTLDYSKVVAPSLSLLLALRPLWPFARPNRNSNCLSRDLYFDVCASCELRARSIQLFRWSAAILWMHLADLDCIALGAMQIGGESNRLNMPTAELHFIDAIKWIALAAQV